MDLMIRNGPCFRAPHRPTASIHLIKTATILPTIRVANSIGHIDREARCAISWTVDIKSGQRFLLTRWAWTTLAVVPTTTAGDEDQITDIDLKQKVKTITFIIYN